MRMICINKVLFFKWSVISVSNQSQSSMPKIIYRWQEITNRKKISEVTPAYGTWNYYIIELFEKCNKNIITSKATSSIWNMSTDVNAMNTYEWRWRVNGNCRKARLDMSPRNRKSFHIAFSYLFIFPVWPTPLRSQGKYKRTIFYNWHEQEIFRLNNYLVGLLDNIFYV